MAISLSNCEKGPSVDEKGNVSANGCESTWVRRRYSEDGRNLLLSIQEESAKRPQTIPTNQARTCSQPSSVGNGKKNIHRTFHTYNDQGVRVETIIDDGTNQDAGDLTELTTRRVTRLTVKREAPFAGIPLVEEEFFLGESGELKLLNKKENQYRRKRTHHQASGLWREQREEETHTWQYDGPGNVTRVTGPTWTIYYAYDANGNRTEEYFEEYGLKRYNLYDRLNRLVQRREKWTPNSRKEPGAMSTTRKASV